MYRTFGSVCALLPPFIYTKMHRFLVKVAVSFDMHLCLCNYRPGQDAENILTPSESYAMSRLLVGARGQWP